MHNILTSQEGNIMKTVPALNASTARETTTPLLPIKACMHVLGYARTDIRVLGEAKALVTDGFAVSIVDIDSIDQSTEYITQISSLEEQSLAH
jgi:hypothetical protein